MWTIGPIYKRKLTGLAQRFGAFSPGFMSGVREPQEHEPYDWVLVKLPSQDKANKKAKKE